MSITCGQALVEAEPKVVEDNDHIPISQRIKQSSVVKTVSEGGSSSATRVDNKSKKIKKPLNNVPSSSGSQKWTTLVHNGVIFPPPYEPHGTKMLYKGKPVTLTPGQEEVATMYAVMLDSEYMKKPQFKENFFNDWRKILGKNHVIQNLKDCDFTPIFEWQKEKKEQISAEEKKAIKEEKMELEEKYEFAIVDGVKEKVGNFRVDPPGFFRGRGEHPKTGKLKRRIQPGDITINIGKDAPIPECPVPGEKWKEVRHDNTVPWLACWNDPCPVPGEKWKEVRHDDTVPWLACWNDPLQPRELKYVYLAPSSTLKKVSLGHGC